MCGIFGIWNRSGKLTDLASVERATNTLRHRGPDDEGYVLVDVRGDRSVPYAGRDTTPGLDLPPLASAPAGEFDLALGFRRLAILDLSSAGHQPMSSPDGRFWIVYNGEVYNYLELRAELAGHGHTFRTGTDTEVILAAYRQWGPECLLQFNGMWAFALWDGRERQLFVARDRFGIKPLYYTQRDNTFVLASEIKALVGHHGIPFEPEEREVHAYLTTGRLPSPQQGRTFFSHVQALPPGHWLFVDQQGVTVPQRYWSLSAPPASASEDTAGKVIEQYRTLFTDATCLRLVSDVPVGTCLSGGVDSSSIVCVTNRLMAGDGPTAPQIGLRQKTFSAVYDAQAPYNERPYVDRVLQATGAEGNLTFPTTEQLAADLQSLVWHQDEPFLSTSIFAQWCVMRRARERGVKVLLDGQGADEALGGYRPFAMFLADLVRQGRLLRAQAETEAIRAVTGSALAPLLVRTTAHLLPAAWLRPLRQRRVVAPEAASALDSGFAAAWGREAAVEPHVYSSLQAQLLDEIGETRLPHLLRYEDRNSMAFGIEARVPFLDFRLVQFSFDSASAWRIHDGWTKWVLRQAMAGIVPEEIIWRTDKVGFATPEAEWTRQWLSANPGFFGPEALSRRYLNLDRVRGCLGSWLKPGREVRTMWRWINLEMWLRVWSWR